MPFFKVWALYNLTTNDQYLDHDNDNDVDVIVQLTPPYVNMTVTADMIADGVMFLTLMLQVPYFLVMGLRFVSLLEYDQPVRQRKFKCLLRTLAGYIIIANLNLVYEPVYMAAVLIPISQT